MKKAILQAPVLMVFFIRPEPFAQVFKAVKAVRPAQLFLFQDGAREGHPDDNKNRMACRKVLEEIDWECDVKTFYPDFNYGVDSSVFAAMKWAFKSVDRLIILEDDIVASQSFFKYCEIMLDQYKDNPDIAMIGGMNHLGTYNPEKSSYIFAQSCAIWGWATWKRFFDTWDRTLSFLDDKNKITKIKKQLTRTGYRAQLKKAKRVRSEALRDENKASFEASATFSRLLNDAYAIVPTKNLITNIGIGADTFHAADSLKKLSSATRKLFFMERFELDFPLIPPEEEKQDEAFNRKINWVLTPPMFVLFLRKLESKIRRLIIK
ncbi:MAG: hypothetical protein AB1Z19_08475 [Eubacteriales bacterium]